jgi:4'-phosphopantetheinyl transferase EntD
MYCMNFIPDDICHLVDKIENYRNFYLNIEEQRVLLRFCEKRRVEFTAGRAIAKYLLEQIGIYDFPILRGRSGDPIWPQGVTGSISHCDDSCFVAIADTKYYKSIGVDIESIEDIPENIIDYVCTCDEINWICSMQCLKKAYPLAKMIFSAKESSFKCIFPLVNKFIEFTEVEIDMSIYDNAFSVKFVHPKNNNMSPFGRYNIRGLIFIDGKYIYSLAFVVA